MLEYVNAKTAMKRSYSRQSVSAVFILAGFYGLTSIGQRMQKHQEGKNFIFLAIDLIFLAIFIWRYAGARRTERDSETKMDEAVRLLANSQISSSA